VGTAKFALLGSMESTCPVPGRRLLWRSRCGKGMLAMTGCWPGLRPRRWGPEMADAQGSMDQIEYRWHHLRDLSPFASSMSPESVRGWDSWIRNWVRHPYLDGLSESVCYQVQPNGRAALAWRYRDSRAAGREAADQRRAGARPGQGGRRTAPRPSRRAAHPGLRASRRTGRGGGPTGRLAASGRCGAVRPGDSTGHIDLA